MPLPDTGLFAPVAVQLAAAERRLAAIPPAIVDAERVRLLVETGRADSAARLLPRLAGHRHEVEVARARVHLARQDWRAAAAAIAAIERRDPLDPAARTVQYAWAFARDDAARADTLSAARLAGGAPGHRVPDLLAAGRVAYDLMDYARAESLYARALAEAAGEGGRHGAPFHPRAAEARAARSAARVGLALVLQKRRAWDASLDTLRGALAEHASPEALTALAQTLIRLGRTDEAISAAQWAVRLAPHHDPAHYLLGNGYARRNYTQLVAAYPGAFADSAGRAALARADSALARGRRAEARAGYERVRRARPGWADPLVRLASLDFEEGRFAAARDRCFEALRLCPEYGRAHAVLAKALEGRRFEIDVHRSAYERRFAAAPAPRVPGIERFVTNWTALSPRHQKRVALSIAPWKAFIPVLVAGGATYFIKPMYMLLSECPGLEPLRDTRINYDSRLWDDVRGAGGYHTVTGIEDVERTIFDRYNTVLHELTHQVHGVLPADDARAIQEHYRRAKERDDATQRGFLSRYAGGSVWEYYAEAANAIHSPRRDAYDPREEVSERLDAIDPDLRRLVESHLARTDVSASYPVAYAAGGDDRVSRGRVDDAIPFYEKALALAPAEETALTSLAQALMLANRGAAAESVALRLVAAHPASGPARVALAHAAWRAGRGLDAARRGLAAARDSVRLEDRWQVSLALGRLAWVAGDAAAALAAFDSVLAYQSDNPEGLRGRAAALALARRWDEAFALYDRAVRERTGVVELRCEAARDLLRAGRVDAARVHLAEARLLDEENPTAEALRGWAALAAGDADAALEHAERALAWGEWSDLARIVRGAALARRGDAAGARAAWAPVEDRIARAAPPASVFRPRLAVWEEIHVLPAVERDILQAFQRGGAR
uniref:Tetratricopeptide repeat protein n=1 Tax=Eiseniibacteriota bacterium TaxID=2212470 RepID=A0A832MM01_UNCEI